MEQFVEANGQQLWCESFGSAGDPAVVLIMGAGTSGIAWDDDLCERLAAAGYRAVRFDNRDIGLSSRVDYEASPYTLSDMADDVAGLMDALAIEHAHIVGVSLGGMVAQEFALSYPRRTLTLGSILSTPSIIDETAGFAHGLPPIREDVLIMMFELEMSGFTTREERIEAAVKVATAFTGSASPASTLSDWRALKAAELDRIAAHFGDDSQEFRAAIAHSQTPNQTVAVSRSRDRVPLLPQVSAPTLVLSGDEDPFFQPAHGKLTADLIPGAEFVVIEGLGHTIPPPAQLTKLLLDLFARADEPSPNVQAPMGLS